MRPLPVRLGAIPWLFRAVLLTAAYFVIAKLGLRYATIGPSISPVWPPTGLAIAALVLFGLRYWPAVLAGAFLANVTTSIPTLDRKSTRLNSSHQIISYAVFCLKKKKTLVIIN